MKERLRGRKVTRSSLLAVIGSIRQQTTLLETMQTWCCWAIRRSVVTIDCGNRPNQWSVHEDTAPEVNHGLSGDLSTSATLKVGMTDVDLEKT